jgi:hypothetical protein
MQPTQLRMYTSSPATLQLAGLGICGTLAARVQLLPLTELPTPNAQRLLALRVERNEIRRDLAVANWHLVQLEDGRCLPDACREVGLRAALKSRLRAVVATLQAVGVGERGNG